MKKLMLIAGLALSFALFLALSPHAHAASITVGVATDADPAANSDGCTLREAIDNANDDAATWSDCVAGSGADTITITATGTLTPVTALPSIIGQTSIVGPGPGQFTIDCTDIDRCLYFDADTFSAANSTLMPASVSGLAVTGAARGATGAHVFGIDFRSTASYGVQATVTNVRAYANGDVTDGEGGIGVTDVDTMTTHSSLDLSRVTLDGNSAGASWLYAGGSMTNTTITGSSFSAILMVTLNSSHDLQIVNSTIAQNTSDAPDFGGVWATSVSTGTLTVQFKNSLLTDNHDSANQSANCVTLNTGNFISQGHNIADDSTCSLAGAGDQQGVSLASINLGTITTVGGQRYFPLLVGSLAIDAGTASGAPATDQLGTARPLGSAYDVGAFESAFTASPSTSPTPSLAPAATTIISTIPRVGVLYALLPVGLALLVMMFYVYYDYRRHRAPLAAEDPNVDYSLQHHIKVVTIPTVSYRIASLAPSPTKTLTK